MPTADSDAVPRPHDDDFWELVAQAAEDFDAFAAGLETMDRAPLIGLAWRFQEATEPLFHPRYHGNRHSDDALEAICGRVVGRGRAFYEEVLAQPERMPRTIEGQGPGMDIQYEAEAVYRRRFGEEMPPFEGDW